MKKIIFSFAGLLMAASSFADIPHFDLNKLLGRHSCKTGDRESRAYYTVKNSGENITFTFDGESHIFWFNRAELQRYLNDEVYYSMDSGVFRAVDGVEDKRDGRTEYFSYELIYNPATREHYMASFMLRNEGGFFSQKIKISCAMISEENGK